MKKLILGIVLVGMLFAYTPVYAQTSSLTDEQRDALILQIQEAINSLLKQVAELIAQQATQQTTLNQIVQNSQNTTSQVVSGTTTPAVETPVSKKDLVIENLTEGDVYLSNQVKDCFKFRIYGLDDSGNKMTYMKAPLLINGSSRSIDGYDAYTYKGSGNYEVGYCANRVGDSVITFNANGITKSVTVTTK